MMPRQPIAEPDLHGGRIRVPRSRGAGSGLLLLLLGLWGALIPLLGPYVHFGYTPDSAWAFSAGRFWLEVLPGTATTLGGLLLLTGANRITMTAGGWLAAAAGAWFIVGTSLESVLHVGSVGHPIHVTALGSAVETLLLFTGLGALILLIAGTALGRLSVVSIRDVRAAQRREYDAATAAAVKRDGGYPTNQEPDAYPGGERPKDAPHRVGSDHSPVDPAAQAAVHEVPGDSRGPARPDRL